MTRDSDIGPNVDRTLAGLRVLEIGHFVAAPFAARLLADLGAEVIKIEPLTGDPARQWGEQIDGKSLWWSAHARNKRSIALDLKHPEAVAIVKRLAARSDALLENFRPGQLDRLGIGPEVLREVQPELIITHISGFGQTGPHRDQAAFGVIGEAIGGLRYLTNHTPGTTELPPVRVGISIGDSIAGLYAVIGLLAALWQRDRREGDRVGRTIDVALTEGILSLMEGMLPEFGALGRIKQPTGGGIGTAAPSNAYPARDGAWILIAANSEPLFRRLMVLLGREDLIGAPGFDNNLDRVARAVELDELIASWTRGFAVSDLLAMLVAADIPSAKVYDTADIAADAQFKSRGMLREVEDPAFGRSVLQAGIVPRIVGDDASVRWPGPPLGADTDYVLGEIAGLDAVVIARLRSEGAVR